MDNITHILICSKILEKCGCDKGHSFYSILPSVSNDEKKKISLELHTLNSAQKLLDSAFSILFNEKNDVARSSHEYVLMEKNKDKLFNDFSKVFEGEIGNNKSCAALALLTHSYLDCFKAPVQFFVPHSHHCSGKWNQWDKMDYFRLHDILDDKKNVDMLRKKILKDRFWNVRFNPEDFPLIVKRRLIKENLTGAKLDSESMMKAIIIRMGELSQNMMNYEIIDYCIRHFFTYLGTKRYLRIDREIRFLRLLEERFFDIAEKI